MSENSKIEWCDHTFNPWEGCQKVGPGCDHCYAEARNARFGGGAVVNWGPGAPRRRTSSANWRKPLAWNDRPLFECRDCGWRGYPASVAGMPACPESRCASFYLVRVRPRVFCASLADVFDNAVDPAWRADLFDLIEKTPNLDWLLLTKRIGNVRAMVEETAARRFDLECLHNPKLPANVWLGATIVNQEEADRDIPKLLATPARVRFLSMEPLLGPVNLRLPTRTWTNSAGNATCDHCCNGDRCDDPTHYERGRIDWRVRCPHCRGTGNGKPIDWVIAGGESGLGARPMHPDWARSLRDQCAAAGVPFLFKQWGEWGMPTDDLSALDWPYHKDHDRTHWFGARECVRPIERGWSEKYSTGGGALPPPPFDLFKTPEYLDQVSRCTQDSCRAAGCCVGNLNRTAVTRVGKKAAGRQLDGRTHDEFPEAR